jgi:TrmH family RNA methyltransferase
MISRCDVCLVGTAQAENLGAVARLLDNFGAPSLTLVAPRVAADDARAQVVARSARDRLLAARRTDGLDEAVAHCAYVVGFSARRGGGRPLVGLRQLPALLAAHAPAGRVALLFGPEDSGLSSAHIDRCDAVAVIDTPGPLPSLNLAQAVALALWELGRSGDDAAPARGGATHAELQALVEHAVAALDRFGHFRGDDERARSRVHWRRTLADAALRGDDVRALHRLCETFLRGAVKE